MCHRRQKPTWCCTAAVLTALAIGTSSGAIARATEVGSDDVQPNLEKLRLLTELQGALPSIAEADASAIAAANDYEIALPDDAPEGRSARVIDGSMAFYGASDFALMVDIVSRPNDSYTGYVVDDPDDEYQDMIILADLSELDAGTHVILAACSDLHKPFPPSGHPMASRPRTSSSPADWAYWARQTALEGLANGYSFEEIQLATWYITDREGQRNSLLSSIGYDSSDPAKNVYLPFPADGPEGCGGGACGALGVVSPLLLLGGMTSIRRQRGESQGRV